MSLFGMLFVIDFECILFGCLFFFFFLFVLFLFATVCHWICWCVFLFMYMCCAGWPVYIYRYTSVCVCRIYQNIRHLNLYSLVWAGVSHFSITLRLQSHAKFGSRRVGLTVNACDLITILLKNVHLGLHSDNWDSENIVKNTACKKAYEETCDKDMMLSVIAYDGSNRICSVMENVLYCMYMYYVVYLTWYPLANVIKPRWRV